MRYFSTRDRERLRPFSLAEAAFLGLAPDGGLFLPESIPSADLSEVRRCAGVSYSCLAGYLAGLFFGDDLPGDVLRSVVQKAYDFDCPLRMLEQTPGGTAAASPVRHLGVLELFHGPTLAFKDFGARFMGGMMGALRSDRCIVLTATSGDTGSAVAAGFHGVAGVDVVVLYPKGRVSELQECQMTTLGGNIHAVAVDGSFDDCQALVKAVFNDADFREKVRVTSANSINILRWIPQSFYYFYAWARWMDTVASPAASRMSSAEAPDAPDVVVPSGNFGNITAGMLAWKMGLPVRRFIAATNANDVVPEYLIDGIYRPRPSVRTLANAMDVGAPSNFERMTSLFGEDFAALSSMLSARAYSDEDILSGISEIHRLYGFLSDPHAATGYLAARDSGASGFYLATAHCAKFPDTVSRATGVDCPLPDALSRLRALPKHFSGMDNSVASLESFLRNL